jgi:hypothetical protein
MDNVRLGSIFPASEKRQKYEPESIPELRDSYSMDMDAIDSFMFLSIRKTAGHDMTGVPCLNESLC